MREHVRNIALDLIFTIVSFGLFNFYVQHRQMVAVNAMIGEKRYGFWKWLLLTLITFGLYHIYHEYKKTLDICAVTGQPPGSEGLVSIILTVTGLHIIADAVQQTHINKYFGPAKPLA